MPESRFPTHLHPPFSWILCVFIKSNLLLAPKLSQAGENSCFNNFAKAILLDFYYQLVTVLSSFKAGEAISALNKHFASYLQTFSLILLVRS